MEEEKGARGKGTISICPCMCRCFDIIIGLSIWLLSKSAKSAKFTKSTKSIIPIRSKPHEYYSLGENMRI